ncbi:MAG: HU family DNA-binding protein [Candidatus Magasanikbacteria bacterium]
MAKVNKAALAEAIQRKVGVSKKEAEEMIAAFEHIVTTELLAGNEVTIAGFGAFSAKTRAGRVGVNPQNPSQKIQIPPVTVPKFKAGKALKDALKGKKSAEVGAQGSAAQARPVDATSTELPKDEEITTSFHSDSTM